MRSVELFTGAGGLALGMARSGFHHDIVIERDHDSCETIRLNQNRGLWPVADWKLNGKRILDTEIGGSWQFSDFVDSPDPDTGQLSKYLQKPVTCRNQSSSPCDAFMAAVPVR